MEPVLARRAKLLLMNADAVYRLGCDGLMAVGLDEEPELSQLVAGVLVFEDAVFDPSGKRSKNCEWVLGQLGPGLHAWAAVSWLA